jgi:hypothetical protein
MGPARLARGVTGSISTAISTVVSSPPLADAISKRMRQFSATPPSPSAEKNSKTPLAPPFFPFFTSFFSHVQVTASGRIGGSPKISFTLSPFLRGLSTGLIFDLGVEGSASSTPKEDKTMDGQFVGVARKVCSSFVDRFLMVVLDVSDNVCVNGTMRERNKKRDFIMMWLCFFKTQVGVALFLFTVGKYEFLRFINYIITHKHVTGTSMTGAWEEFRSDASDAHTRANLLLTRLNATNDDFFVVLNRKPKTK